MPCSLNDVESFSFTSWGPLGPFRTLHSLMGRKGFSGGNGHSGGKGRSGRG